MGDDMGRSCRWLEVIGVTLFLGLCGWITRTYPLGIEP